jgi:hypothetical protein
MFDLLVLADKVKDVMLTMKRSSTVSRPVGSKYQCVQHLSAKLMCQIAFILAPLAFGNCATALADPMSFKSVSTGGNHCCWWTAAEGEITDSTPDAFKRYLTSEQYPPTLLRLNSLGGSLIGALELGLLIREHNFETEVGHTDGFNKLPGVCASACAYAFMGGVARSLEEGAKLGVHRFYNRAAIQNYSAKQFSGGDLDSTQRTFAALVLYLLKVGVKAEVVGLADQAGPENIYWINPSEAAELGITHDPKAWTPWKIEPYKAGLTAFSRSMDGNAQMTILCTRHLGPQLILTVKNWDHPYAVQEAGCARNGYHPILGSKVPFRDVGVSEIASGGYALKFKLPPTVPFSNPALFSDFDSYPYACMTGFRGNEDGLAQAGRLAIRNCIDEK